MSGPVSTQPEQGQPASFSANESARSFIRVLQTVEPVAERECRVRTSQVNCDFNIVVDDRPGQPANAYQTEDKAGRPVIDIQLESTDAFSLGQYFQMLMLATVVEGRLLGLNPYGQPGVEAYKTNMKTILGIE